MPKLVYMYTSGTAPHWFRPAWSDQIEIEYFDVNTTYSTDTVFYYDMYGPLQEHIKPQLAAGHKIIYDAKNEHYLNPSKDWVLQEFSKHPGQGMFIISGHTPDDIPGIQVVATPYWYWIMDQPNFVNNHYHDYVPQPRHQYRFFMQLSLQRQDRDQLFRQIAPIRQWGMYSYRSQGIHLPNDVDPRSVPNWQRYMNWNWINACSITLVVESNLDDKDFTGISITRNNNRFICEKTYKPLAYGHAFLMAGNCGNLAHVREQGFETFPELWDESYDELPLYTDRIDRLVDIIKQFDPAALSQPRVQQKIAHNRARFFDRELTQRLQKETIVDPVLRFVHA